MKTIYPILIAILLTMPAQICASGAIVVYDFAKHFEDAKISNALSAGTGAKAFTSGKVRKYSIALHPTSGEATATYNITLPVIGKGERLVIIFSAGMADGFVTNDPDHPSDGVKFILRIDGREVFTRDLATTGWSYGAADLTEKAGKKVNIVFVTDAKSNSNYDWAAWGEPQILRLRANQLGKNGLSTACAGIVTAKASQEGVSLELTPISKSGSPSGKGIKIPLTPKSLTAVEFDLCSSRPSAVQVKTVGGKAEQIGIFAFEPQLQILSFGPPNALIFGDKPLEMRCVVKNAGKGLLGQSASVKAQLTIRSISASASAKTKGISKAYAVQSIGPLYPGEQKTIIWRNISVPKADIIAATVKILENGNPIADKTIERAISVRPTISIPEPKKAESKKLQDGTIVLQNPFVRMTFVKNNAGYTGWMLSIPREKGWSQVASGAPLGFVHLPDVPSSNGVALYPKNAQIEMQNGKPAVIFTTTQNLGTSPCKFRWSFTLDTLKPIINASHSMTAEKNIDIVCFFGPTVYVGDGGFGSKKSDGLFPGLEYLLTEASSGTENVSPPANLRIVPHPNKITIPFMAIRYGSVLVSLEWDPLQKWDGASNRPAAVFASPNFIDGQENHKIGLFVPSVPEWTQENKLTADKPYKLTAGNSLTLSADIIVRTNSTSIIDAVDEWISRHGIPSITPIEKKPSDVMLLCDKAFLETIWDPEAKGWKHTNTSPPSFDARIANYLLRKTMYVMDPQRKKAYSDVVQAAIEKAGRENMDLEVALLAGEVDSALKRMAERANFLMSKQRHDGSWPFEPDEKHSVLGKAGDTSSGYSAANAVQLLEYALITCDTKATEAGLKAIKYLDTQKRPEGAQTWELQLHVPDILAAAHLVRAYTMAYQITNDKKHLERAVYWAKTGLPFVYLWNAPDRPIMRYGTIPVFGATWFDGMPWFGNCVQWCGMVYAYSLARLSDFDQTLPWQEIAKGIFFCGAQQQEYATQKYPNEAGMYPDAFSVVTGEEAYHWNLNPGLIAMGMVRISNLDCMPYTITCKGPKNARIAVTLPAQIGSFGFGEDFLRGKFSFASLNTVHIVLGGTFPDSITINRVGIERVKDVDAVEQGWQYNLDTKIAIIKTKTQRENIVAVDLLSQVLGYDKQLMEEMRQKEQQENQKQ
ncbi:MAG: hypothetical protein K6T99_06190 [Armatimonadetes bacterium]|nr:hypothetical protein [Armatimonadota bacterium]